MTFRRIALGKSETIQTNTFYLLCWLFALLSLWRPAQALEFVELNEDNLLVVELGVENLELIETLFIFQQPEATLIPLQGLVDTLDFPLNIDVAARTVDGWFIEESNTFSLDIKSKTLFIRGQKQDWPSGYSYAADDFDLYFDYRLLEQWLRLHLHLNISQLSLLISSDVELPVVVQQKRRKIQEKLNKEKQTSLPENYLTNKYQYLGDPLFDIEVSDDLQHNRGHFEQFTGAVIQGRMDLFKHSMQSSYIYADGEDDVRLTFSRSSAGPDTDMWLGLKEYELGDISSNSNSLLYGSIKGRGVNLSRENSTGLDQVDAVILEGDAPPGWEVELYRNGSLVAFTDAGANGRYIFSEVPTFVGQNIFDIRIYGPQGQYRTRKEQINIGPGMIKENEWGYRIYALENNTRLIPLGNDESSLEPESDFFMGEVTYGLNDYITLQTSVIELTPKESSDAHYYGSIDAFSSLAGAFLHLKWVDDTESGNAYAAIAKGKWGSVNFNFDLLKFNGLVSDENPDNLKRADVKIGINGVTRKLFDLPMTYDFEIKDTEFRGNLSRQTSYINRMSFNLLSANIAHDLRYTTTSDEGIDDLLNANLSVNKRMNQWRFKADVDYALAPTGRINGLGSSASWMHSSRFMYQAQINYAFSENDELNMNNTFTWNFDHLALSLDAGFTNNGNQSVGLSLNTAIGYDQRREQFLMSKDSISSSGTATVKVYLDKNNDSVFNAGDEAIEGVTFKGRAAWKKLTTDSNGITTLNGIPPKELQLIEIDEGSLGDPFLRIQNATRHVYTHAGASNYLEFAVSETFEIEGAVEIVRQGNSSIRSGIPVQLFNTNGKVVAESSTEFDGVFIVERVIPGEYQLKIAEPFLNRHRLLMLSPVHVVARGGEGVVYLDQITLVPNG